MRTLKKTLLIAMAGAGVLALSAASASAAIVCSGNVCWHTQESYQYPPDSRVVVHEDNWTAEPSVTFREHEGRGYWRDNGWIELGR